MLFAAVLQVLSLPMDGPLRFVALSCALTLRSMSASSGMFSSSILNEDLVQAQGAPNLPLAEIVLPAVQDSSADARGVDLVMYGDTRLAHGLQIVGKQDCQELSGSI